jgi:hypothetical protein
MGLAGHAGDRSSAVGRPLMHIANCERCRIPPRHHAFVFPRIRLVHYEVWCKKCGVYECTDRGEPNIYVIGRWNLAQATTYIRPQRWFRSAVKAKAFSEVMEA